VRFGDARDGLAGRRRHVGGVGSDCGRSDLRQGCRIFGGRCPGLSHRVTGRVGIRSEGVACGEVEDPDPTGVGAAATVRSWIGSSRFDDENPAIPAPFQKVP